MKQSKPVVEKQANNYALLAVGCSWIPIGLLFMKENELVGWSLLVIGFPWLCRASLPCKRERNSSQRSSPG
ncbi:hypothetical protein IPL68_01425 [Candidatus Saccharibacteria bacterium]|nr:MAG: hypothetical protein IPL68_01425 [Candidatus Saccharibacteria bacterium]